jgi:alpha-galactosidase
MRFAPKAILLLQIGVLCSLDYARGEDRVKVFVLAGQSNMEGKGRVEPGLGGVNGAIGSLRYQVNNDPVKYGHLVNGGNWVVRDDVYVWSTTAANNAVEMGNLTVGFGSGDFFGPELGFGNVVGNSISGQVLLIKTAWGGKSLAVDFRPPSSGGAVGYYYNEVVKDVKYVLQNLATEFPGYHGQGIELVGFGWHQGWNDRVTPAYVTQYEQNMANFIKDIRKDLNAPNLPFVIGATGQGGTLTGDALKLLEAQMAMANATKYPEFAGNVAAVDTRSFYRTKDVSPVDQDYHWNGNGESYYLIGDSMGNAINTLNPAPAIFYPFGDLNRDEKLSVADWQIFIGNSHKNLSGMTAEQAALLGDMDGDRDNDIADFGLFRDAYDRANGAGAFATMVASVPEPNSILLLASAAAGLAVWRRRRSSRIVLAIVAALGVVSAWGGPLQAANPVIYEPFDYPTGGLNGRSGTTEIGLVGTWNANAETLVVANSLSYSWLPTAGGSIGNLSYYVNRYGGTRAVSPSALAGNGLLNDGATLWFGLEMGYGRNAAGTPANLTNARLGFALANSQFNAGNYQYYINNEGTQLGSGVGVTLGNVNGGSGRVAATHFRDSTAGTGINGNVLGSWTGAGTAIGQDGHGLFVGKIAWGATPAALDTIEIYQPDGDMNIGNPISSLQVAVDQSTFDAITFTRSDPVTMDEIRFGATYQDVVGEKPYLTLRVNPVTGATAIRGDPLRPVSFNYYQITSAGRSLKPADWVSLAAQDFDGNGPPNGSGNGWEEAGGVGPQALAEAYLLGNSTIGTAASVSLGKGYDPAVGARDLAFSYLNSDGKIFEGVVEYAPVLTTWTHTAGNKKWNDSANWDNYLPDAAGAVAQFGTAATTVTVDANVKVGAMKFTTTNNCTVGGTNSITMQTTAGNALIDLLASGAAHTIGVPLVIASSTDINGPGALTAGDISTNGGTSLNINTTVSAGDIGGLGNTSVAAGARLTADSIVQNTLTIAAGGSVTIRETTGAAGANPVPEPGTWALIDIGLLNLLAFLRLLRLRNPLRATAVE